MLTGAEPADKNSKRAGGNLGIIAVDCERLRGVARVDNFARLLNQVAASHGAATAEQSAREDIGIGAGDGAIDIKGALIDGGIASVSVRSGEVEGTGSDLGQRASGAAVLSTVLDDAREGGAAIIAADGKVIGAEEHIAVAFKRANRDARRSETADIHASVSGDRHPSRAAGGIAGEIDHPTQTAVCASIRDQGGAARGGVVRGIECIRRLLH